MATRDAKVSSGTRRPQGPVSARSERYRLLSLGAKCAFALAGEWAIFALLAAAFLRSKTKIKVNSVSNRPADGPSHFLLFRQEKVTKEKPTWTCPLISEPKKR